MLMQLSDVLRARCSTSEVLSARSPAVSSDGDNVLVATGGGVNLPRIHGRIQHGRFRDARHNGTTWLEAL